MIQSFETVELKMGEMTESEIISLIKAKKSEHDMAKIQDNYRDRLKTKSVAANIMARNLAEKIRMMVNFQSNVDSIKKADVADNKAVGIFSVFVGHKI